MHIYTPRLHCWAASFSGHMVKYKEQIHVPGLHYQVILFILRSLVKVQ